MIQKYIITISLALLCSPVITAQLTISNGNHILEVTGGVSAYYNYRNLKPTSDNRNKDRFRLRDAQFKLEGRISDVWEYELQVDFVDIAQASNGIVDPENPGLMDAFVIYKGLGFMDVQAGYGKLYYSRSSLVPFGFTPYWQRAQIARGELFSRRDVGVTLSKGFWRQQVNVHMGVYTGLGEISLNGDNDASGKPEYVGRIDISYPSRYRYRDIDDKISPIPIFSLGLIGRYTNKALPEGRDFPAGAAGEYGYKAVSGKRYIYGLDFSVQYMGFSGQFEIHQIRAEPNSPSDGLYQGLTPEQTEGYVLAGGLLTQLNYFSKNLNTIFSIRYEELDLSDLVPGKSQRISPAIAYQIDGYNAMIKFQYFNILKEESLDPLRWTEQFRIGLLFQFK